MLRAVIFDVDGTLVDSNDLHARAWQEAFAHFGIDMPFDRVRSQIGKGADQLIPSLLPASSAKKLYEPLSEYRSSLFKEKYLDQVRGFPAVRVYSFAFSKTVAKSRWHLRQVRKSSRSLSKRQTSQT
ncbi:MAG: HAD family hydrolase [Terriglobales bacterium]